MTENLVALNGGSSHAAGDGTAAPRPAWMELKAPREAQPAIPVAPSRLAPYDFDDTGEPTAHSQRAAEAAGRKTEVSVTSPRSDDPNRFLRGTLTHALLQHLPGLPSQSWPKSASAFLDVRGAELSRGVRASIKVETLSILNDATFAALFGSSSRAEVPIVAELPNPAGKGPAIKLNGQIDRLVEMADEILILDYKTNRPAPTQLSQVPAAYLMQLAAYKLALAAIFPGKSVRAALLWTQTPSLMEIPGEILDAYCSRLWELGTRTLDVTGLPT